jgi:hypothetical protein
MWDRAAFWTCPTSPGAGQLLTVASGTSGMHGEVPVWTDRLRACRSSGVVASSRGIAPTSGQPTTDVACYGPLVPGPALLPAIELSASATDRPT